MPDTKKLVINNETYIILKPAPEVQSKILRILKRRATTMEMLTSAVLGGGMTRYAAVLNLGQNATDDELDYIDEHMLYIIEKESGKKISVEDFDGAWDVREQLVMGALEANYGSFFDYLGLIGKEHLKALEENQAKTTGTI